MDTGSIPHPPHVHPNASKYDAPKLIIARIGPRWEKLDIISRIGPALYQFSNERGARHECALACFRSFE